MLPRDQAQHNFATLGFMSCLKTGGFFPAKNSQKSELRILRHGHITKVPNPMLDGEKKLGQAACWFTFFVASFYDTSMSYHLGPEVPPKRKKKKHEGK